MLSIDDSLRRPYKFRLVNVFAESTFGGNPLCVFEDGRGLSDEEMLALARQFNLSETTFILPSERADALVRIFTPDYEMRFAGHPTLGTAHVLRKLNEMGDDLHLELRAGIVPVQAKGDVWTLTAPSDGIPRISVIDQSSHSIASLFGLRLDDLLEEPCWVDMGTDQLLIPVKSVEAVQSVFANAALFAQWPLNSLERKSGYIFALRPDRGNNMEVEARYFFATAGGGVAEDPGTGSACANLGGWFIHKQRSFPFKATINQGLAVKRPCKLLLEVTTDRQIRVGGRVLEFARGVVEI
jgi:PhzF family phenazine biosynthesis protein